jgi:hypothetical protein
MEKKSNNVSHGAAAGRGRSERVLERFQAIAAIVTRPLGERLLAYVRSGDDDEIEIEMAAQALLGQVLYEEYRPDIPPQLDAMLKMWARDIAAEMRRRSGL